MSKILKRREPFIFMLYLAMFGSFLLFFFILLVFINKEYTNTQSVEIFVPKTFWISTFVILLSSFSLWLAHLHSEKDSFNYYRFYLFASLILSGLFIYFQLIGWKTIFDSGLTMANNTGASFIYILTGLHILHTLGGIFALIYANYKAFVNINYIDSFVYSVNPANKLRLKLISHYWHFVDLLWVILFLFLVYHAS